ncbi:MAG: right-handed parallel beta-helix repeat-containing protein [Nibricoccus sp.]
MPLVRFSAKKNLCLFSVVLLSIFAAPVPAAEFWVSPDGRDTNVGTQESPLATAFAALRKARELRRLSPSAPEGGVRIILRGGSYWLDQPLIVRPEDSGTAASPTTIEAASGERPVLRGGVPIAGWRLEASIEKLPASAAGKVWSAPVPVFNGRALEFRQLWVGNRKAIRARTPNGSTMDHLLSWDREKEVAGIQASLAPGLPKMEGVEMVIAQQWAVAFLRLRSVRTEGEQTLVSFHQPESRIEFEHPWPQPILKNEGGSGAFFLVNALEFLDEPGEWYLDQKAGRVYYWPREGEELAQVPVIAPALESLVEIAGTLDRPVHHVQFRGIAFQNTTWLRPSFAGHVPLQAGFYITEAYKLKPKGTPDWRSLDNQTWTGRPAAGVVVSGAQEIRFERCRFEHMAMSGLDFVSGTQDNVVEGCLFRDIGNNAIQIGSFQGGGIESHLPYSPQDEREICARLRVSNNFINDAANEDWGGVAIMAGYVRDTSIVHNEISDTSYMGVSVGWGWTRTPNVMRHNLVHANRFDRVCTRMCDDAAIYTLSAQPGTVVSENVISEIKMSPYVDRPDHWFYLYTDEGSSFITVRDNWCPEPKFLQNANGPGNVWENNGPQVAEKIRNAAGLEAAYQDLRAEPYY